MLKKTYCKFIKAYSTLEMSFAIAIIAILFVGVYEGINIYRETIISRSQSLTQSSIINRIPSLLSWYETSLPNSFLPKENSDNNSVSKWLDNSSSKIQKDNAYGGQKYFNNKFNFESNPTVNSSGPLFVGRGINNLPALKFDNSSTKSQFLVVDPQIKLSDTNFSIYMVIKFDNKNVNATILDRVCFASNNEVTDQEASGIEACKSNISLKINNLNKIEFSITNSSNQSAQLSSLDSLDLKYAHLIAVERNFNNNLNLFIDGKLSATQDENLGSLSSLPLKFGRSAFASNLEYNFNIGEIIIFEDVLLPKFRIEVENYLSRKFSINLNR